MASPSNPSSPLQSTPSPSPTDTYTSQPILAPLPTSPSIPTHCHPSHGAPLHPDRTPAPCPICHTDILPTDPVLTHTLAPCFMSFHAECLMEWLPFAKHVPQAAAHGPHDARDTPADQAAHDARGGGGINTTDSAHGITTVQAAHAARVEAYVESLILQNAAGVSLAVAPLDITRKQPSCPNCRGSLGECDLPIEGDGDGDEMEIEVDESDDDDDDDDDEMDEMSESELQRYRPEERDWDADFENSDEFWDIDDDVHRPDHQGHATTGTGYRRSETDWTHDEFIRLGGIPRYAYPVESLDEIRRLVGDEEFMRLPLSRRRHVHPVGYAQIPIDNYRSSPRSAATMGQTRRSSATSIRLGGPPASVSTASQIADARADIPGLEEFPDFLQELRTYSAPDARSEIDALMPPQSTRTVGHGDGEGDGVIDADAIRALFRSLHVSSGVTHWEAYNFLNTIWREYAFYRPIYPAVIPMQSLTQLRARMFDLRVFADPAVHGRWLRGPLVRSEREIREILGRDPQRADLDRVVKSVRQDPRLTLDGFALWLPSDFSNSFAVYAVPWVCVDVSSLPGREAGDMACGFLLEDGQVDFRRYWSRHFDMFVYSSEGDVSSEAGLEDVELRARQDDFDCLVFDRLLHWEMTGFERGQPSVIKHFGGLPGVYIDTPAAWLEVQRALEIAEYVAGTLFGEAGTASSAVVPREVSIW